MGFPMWNRPSSSSSSTARTSSRDVQTNKDREPQSVADALATRRGAIRRRTRRYAASPLPSSFRDPRSSQQVLLDLLSFSAGESSGSSFSSSGSNSERSSVGSSLSPGSSTSSTGALPSTLAEARSGVDNARRELSGLARMFDEPSLDRYTNYGPGGMDLPSLIDTAPPPSVLRRLRRPSPSMPSSRSGAGLPSAWDSREIYSTRLTNSSGRFPREDVDLYERESSRRGATTERARDSNENTQNGSRDDWTPRGMAMDLAAPSAEGLPIPRPDVGSTTRRFSPASSRPASRNPYSTTNGIENSPYPRTLSRRRTHDSSRDRERAGGENTSERERETEMLYNFYFSSTSVPSFPSSLRNRYIIDGLGDRERSLSPDLHGGHGNSDLEEPEIEEPGVIPTNDRANTSSSLRYPRFGGLSSNSPLSIPVPPPPPPLPSFLTSSSPLGNMTHDAIICDYSPYSSDSEDSNDGPEVTIAENGSGLGRLSSIPWENLRDRLTDRNLDRNGGRAAFMGEVGNWRRVGLGRLSERERENAIERDRDRDEVGSVAATIGSASTRMEGL